MFTGIYLAGAFCSLGAYLGDKDCAKDSVSDIIITSIIAFFVSWFGIGLVLADIHNKIVNKKD